MSILLFALPGFQVTEAVSTLERWMVYAESMVTQAVCPACQAISGRVHSYYRRCPTDLPSSGKSVQLVLRVRRFRCLNSACQRKTFAERLPALPVSARQTSRLGTILESLAVVRSCEAGSRLAQQFGMAVSADTLLRRAKKPSPHQALLPKVLGVDDFANRARP